MVEGKNSLRERRDILVLNMILNDFSYTALILIYDVLSFFRLYYIHFKEVKSLWGPRVGGGADNPNTHFRQIFKEFVLNK